MNSHVEHVGSLVILNLHFEHADLVNFWTIEHACSTCRFISFFEHVFWICNFIVVLNHSIALFFFHFDPLYVRARREDGGITGCGRHPRPRRSSEERNRNEKKSSRWCARKKNTCWTCTLKTAMNPHVQNAGSTQLMNLHIQHAGSFEFLNLTELVAISSELACWTCRFSVKLAYPTCGFNT